MEKGVQGGEEGTYVASFLHSSKEFLHVAFTFVVVNQHETLKQFSGEALKGNKQRQIFFY